MKINGLELFVNGERIFEAPMLPSADKINLATRIGDTILVGTGSCCHGQVYTLERNDKGWMLVDIVSVPTNIFAIQPLHGTSCGSLPLSSHDVNLALVAGYGCNGKGVWVIGPRRSLVVQILDLADMEGELRGLKFQIDGTNVTFDLRDWRMKEWDLGEILARFGQAAPLEHELVYEEQLKKTLRVDG